MKLHEVIAAGLGALSGPGAAGMPVTKLPRGRITNVLLQRKA